MKGDAVEGLVVSPLKNGRRRFLALLAAALIALAGGAVGVMTAQPASAATVDTSAWYTLINRNSGKALDVCGSSTADGACVQQYSRSGGTNQQFQFVDSGSGFYRLRVKHSGKVLDDYNYSTANGAAVVQWTDGNGTNQQWSLADSSGGYVRLINRNSGKALEVQNAATTDGARVVQYDDWGGTNQQWQLVPVGTTTPPTTSPTSGPSTFTNPVVWQDFADGDIIRVGDVYYYSASTMHYSPGAPILRSYDLVNWEYAGHSIPRLDFDSAAYDLNGGRAYVKGIWASAFNYRPSDSTYYWLGCTEFNRTYVYSSKSIESGWSAFRR
jgi:ricin-type beta-trefoil lectin protein/glycosyl hydrolase family 43